jgi:membrane protein DedA with SNARE-associated domain
MVLEAILARYGLLAIFAGAVVEGETVVLVGGLLAHQGLMPLTGVAAAATAGSFLADQFFFQIGRRFRDRPYVQRITQRPAFLRAHSLLERHPTAFIFAFRFLYGLRTISPIAIGTSAVPTGTFALLNGFAAVLWGTVIACLGYGFGHGIELAFGRLHSIEHIMVVAAAFLGTAILFRWIARWRRFSPKESFRRAPNTDTASDPKEEL